MTLLKSGDTRSKFRPSVKDVVGSDFEVGRGQRKLCIMLIQFLTDFWDPDKYPDITVLYVGAAPGRSFRVVSRMFPSITFHLYDPAKFDVEESDRIKIHNKLFEEKDALEWKGKDILFVSDIRTPFSFETNTSKQIEDIMIKDMTLQANLVKIMQPIAACLKCRPPYPSANVPREFEYFKGWTRFQAWAPERSSETRLICLPPYETVKWDIVKYDLQMAFHNDIVRSRYVYKNLLAGLGAESQTSEQSSAPSGSSGYDQKDVALASLGYDSSLEVFSLLRYTRKMRWPDSPTRINNLRTLISQLLGERTMSELGIKVQPNTHIVGTKPKHIKDLTNMFNAVKRTSEDRGPITTILDGTAHVGSESLLAAKIFKETLNRLIAIEIDAKTYESLVENTKSEPKISPVQGDVVKYLRSAERPAFDIIILDPLFDSMKKDSKGEMELYLGDTGVVDFITELFQQQQARVVLLHAPLDYQKLKPQMQLTGRVGRVNKTVWNISNDFSVFVLVRNMR